MQKQCDDLIWSTISTGFCSFKTSFNKNNFCRNKYNVTGLCNRSSCPLANSRYATVIEKDNITYLCVKTIERAQAPNKLWEKIKLSGNHIKALEQIDEELLYWPKLTINKCKLRLTRIRQCILRAKKLELGDGPILTPIKKKAEKRMKSREMKAERTTKIRLGLEKELLMRLKEGIYGENILDEEKDCNELLNELAEHDYGTLNGAMVDYDDNEYFVANNSDNEGSILDELYDLDSGETDIESLASSTQDRSPSSNDSNHQKRHKNTSSEFLKPKKISRRKKRNTEIEYENNRSKVKQIN